MPIIVIVEDGTLPAGANSYVSVADATAQLALDPFVLNWAGLTSDQKAGLVIKASALLDARMTWRGARIDNDQPMLWPRHDATDDDGYTYDDDEIPVVLPRATAILASSLADAFVAGTNPEVEQNSLKGFSRVKVDVIELDVDKTDRPTVVPDTVTSMLLGIGGSRETSMRTVKLQRT